MLDRMWYVHSEMYFQVCYRQYVRDKLDNTINMGRLEMDNIFLLVLKVDFKLSLNTLDFRPSISQPLEQGEKTRQEKRQAH